MGPKIIARICKDPGFVYYTMVTIMKEVAEDKTDPYRWQPKPNETFIEMVVERTGERVGLYKLDFWNHTTMRFHPNILPEYRRKYLKACTEPIYRFLFENFGHVHKYIGFIPNCFPNVISYGIKNGWQKEGEIKDGFFKYGKFHDVTQLGITSSQIKESLNG